MEDPEFNIKFVNLIKSHPCVYNFTLPSYNNKKENDKAWNAISNDIGESVDECKTKWKNLRGCLTRYIRHMKTAKTNSKIVKQYYLYSAMEFVLPFTKTRKRRCSAIPADDTMSEATIVKEESSDFYRVKNSAEITLMDADQVEPINSRQNDTQENDPLAQTTRMHILSKDDENADLNFFKSILPDIAAFSPHQKRMLKQKLLQIIDEIATLNGD